MEEKTRPLSPVRGSGKANRIAAFVSIQRIPKLDGRRVSPPFPDHRTAPPQAGQFAPLYSLACGPVFGGQVNNLLAYSAPIVLLIVHHYQLRQIFNQHGYTH